MSESEKKTLKKLARLLSGDHLKVVLPALPVFRPLAADPNKAWREDWDEWHRMLGERVTNELLTLAGERKAQFQELAKVADLLIEYAPPEARGTKGKDRASIFMLVALELRKGTPEKIACELSGITKKTFDKWKEDFPNEWHLARKLITKTAEKVSNEEMLKIAKSPLRNK